MNTKLICMSALLLALLCSSSLAYTPPENSAAVRFMEVRDEQGFEAAFEELKQMAAAPEGTWFIDDRELRYAAMELQWEDSFAEALEMMEYLTELFEDSAVAWYVLGDAYIIEADEDNARRCLDKALEIAPDFPDPQRLLDNMDQYISIAKVQVAARGKWRPGQNTGLRGPFMGFEPPGETPEVFAPGVISTSSNEFSITFHPDGSEIYVSKSGIGVMVCRETDEGWTAPELVRFFDEPMQCDEPNFAPDGRSMLVNVRPTVFDERVIFRVPREGAGWGEPVELFGGMFASATLENVIFCTITTGRPDYGVIGRYEPAGDGYGEPEVVGGGVNSERLDAHPWIAPDESFIIFDTDRAGRGEGGIHVCFNSGGEWGEAHRLSERLNIRHGGQPALSPDLKYLFYCEHGDIWWVEAGRVLDELRQ